MRCQRSKQVARCSRVHHTSQNTNTKYAGCTWHTLDDLSLLSPLLMAIVGQLLGLDRTNWRSCGDVESIRCQNAYHSRPNTSTYRTLCKYSLFRLVVSDASG